MDGLIEGTSVAGMVVLLREMLACLRSGTKKQTDPAQDEVEIGGPDAASSLGEHVLVEGGQLGHVGDGVLREAGPLGCQKHVSRGVGPYLIRSEGDADDGLDVASVERVRLNDEYRPAKSRFGATGFIEVCPPNVPL